MTPKAALGAISTHLPERTLTNDDLARESPKWTPESIYAKTGIRTRHIAAADETASDLAAKAALNLFETGLCSPDEIDFLLFCTQSPDYFLPASACILQERIGLRTAAGALDINQGCSGFVYGLSLAKGLIESGTARNVLLLTADTYSKHLAEQDLATKVLFGDGAAATLVTAASGEREMIGPVVFGTDGRGAKNLIVAGGGMRCRAAGAAASASSVSPHLYMNGPEIFNFTLNAIPGLIGETLERSGLTSGDVDFYVFHQANRFMLEHLRQKLGIPADKFCINMEHYGNTVSATIPMALELAKAQGQVRPGDRVMLVGFGVGYSWAATMATIL